MILRPGESVFVGLSGHWTFLFVNDLSPSTHTKWILSSLTSAIWGPKYWGLCVKPQEDFLRSVFSLWLCFTHKFPWGEVKRTLSILVSRTCHPSLLPQNMFKQCRHPGEAVCGQVHGRIACDLCVLESVACVWILGAPRWPAATDLVWLCSRQCVSNLTAAFLPSCMKKRLLQYILCMWSKLVPMSVILKFNIWSWFSEIRFFPQQHLVRW